MAHSQDPRLFPPSTSLAYANAPAVLAAPKKPPVKKTLLGAVTGAPPPGIAPGMAPAAPGATTGVPVPMAPPISPVPTSVNAPGSVAPIPTTMPAGASIDPAAQRSADIGTGAFPPPGMKTGGLYRAVGEPTPLSPVQASEYGRLVNQRGAMNAASAASDQRMAAQQPPAPGPITGDQAAEQGRRQGIGGAFGMTGPAGPGVTDYYDQQRAREGALAASGAALNARLPTGRINPATGLPMGLPGGPGSGLPETYSSVGGAEERTFMNAPLRNPPPSLAGAVAGRRQMIPMTEEERTKSLELLGAQSAKDMARADMRQQIAQAGGIQQPKRGGLAGFMDNMLGRQQPGLDPSALSPEQQSTFADVQRGEAAKAKRAAYLAGTGEYAGRGPQDRANAIAAERAPVTANAQQDAQERRWRMSGGPQQQMLNNYMAARNPALALGMMRQNQENQRAMLDAQIQREELGIRRDELAGRRDDNALARRDAMIARRDEMGLDREKLGAATKESGLNRDAAATQAGSAEANAQRRFELEMEQTKQRDETQRIANETAQKGMEATVEAAKGTEHPNATPEEKAWLLKPGTGPKPPGLITVNEANANPESITAVPESLRAYNDDDDAFITAARSAGYTPEALAKLVKVRSGKRSATVRNPQGIGLWDITTGDFETDTPWADWWNNR